MADPGTVGTPLVHRLNDPTRSSGPIGPDKPVSINLRMFLGDLLAAGNLLLTIKTIQ
jgi:hypothetical protein